LLVKVGDTLHRLEAPNMDKTTRMNRTAI